MPRPRTKRRRVVRRVLRCKCGHVFTSAFRVSHWEACPKCRRSSYYIGPWPENTP